MQNHWYAEMSIDLYPSGMVKSGMIEFDLKITIMFYTSDVIKSAELLQTCKQNVS